MWARDLTNSQWRHWTIDRFCSPVFVNYYPHLVDKAAEHYHFPLVGFWHETLSYLTLAFVSAQPLTLARSSPPYILSVHYTPWLHYVGRRRERTRVYCDLMRSGNLLRYLVRSVYAVFVDGAQWTVHAGGWRIYQTFHSRALIEVSAFNFLHPPGNFYSLLTSLPHLFLDSICFT